MKPLEMILIFTALLLITVPIIVAGVNSVITHKYRVRKQFIAEVCMAISETSKKLQQDVESRKAVKEEELANALNRLEKIFKNKTGGNQ